MTKQEFARLKAFDYARKNAPWANRVGKRHAKGRAKGVGQVLRFSRVHSDIHLLDQVPPLTVRFPANPREFKPTYYKS